MKNPIRLLATILLFWTTVGHAQAADTQPRFGAYVALAINSEVVKGVKHDEEDKVWLLLNPAFKEKELQLKISQSQGADYRKWYTGSEILISAANQGKAANEWADWIRTQSPYIEYWMDGKLILHLKRAD